jgi:magnesium transporter
MIMHFPALRHSHTSKEQEVDFVLGHNFLITAHYDTIDSLHKFSKVFEVNSVLGKSELGDHAGFLLFFMLKKLYKAVEHEIEYIRQDLTRIEEHIFSGREVQMVKDISKSARDLLNLKQIIEPHREVLRDFEVDGPRFFGEEYATYARAISNEYYRVHNHMSRSTEALHELRETNNSLLTTRQNEAMRTFTILAFSIFPLTLFATLFSMDTVHTPIVGAPHDFWIIVGIMGIALVAMFAFFRYKEWL